MTMNNILQLVTCIIFIILVVYAIPVTKQRIGDEKLDFIKKWVEITVYAVQQMNWALPGAERKQLVIEKVTNILSAYGIKITDSELDLLIEAAVKGMKIGQEIAKV